jgi:CPA1 family monovalent cation:H+ antiporter
MHKGRWKLETLLAGFSTATLLFVLLIASLVAIVTRRARLPYAVGLVTAGIVLALLPIGVQLPLTRDLIFDVILPPLIFEAALQLKWSEFRRDLPLTLILAFPGVAVAAAFVAVAMHYLAGWGWMGSAFFGVLIAATDPVSVLAAFKEMKAERRLSTVIEAESLLNDGAAAVGFILLVGIAAGASATPFDIAYSVVWTAAGGTIVGLAVAGAMAAIAGRTQDHLVEITLTTIAAYGSFLAAERLHMSGVLAALAAGLLFGNAGGRFGLSPSGRQFVYEFWDYAAFLVNSIVFILIGGHEARQPIHLVTGAAGLAIFAVLLGRALAVYPLCWALGRTSVAVDMRYRHVLVWGGLRGALALALALALPPVVPEQREIVVVSFAVVAFSIFAQGLTMPGLLRRLDLLRKS